MTYRVTADITLSGDIYVDALSADEAERIAIRKINNREINLNNLIVIDTSIYETEKDD